MPSFYWSLYGPLSSDPSQFGYFWHQNYPHYDQKSQVSLILITLGMLGTQFLAFYASKFCSWAFSHLYAGTWPRRKQRMHFTMNRPCRTLPYSLSLYYIDRKFANITNSQQDWQVAKAFHIFTAVSLSISQVIPNKFGHFWHKSRLNIAQSHKYTWFWSPKVYNEPYLVFCASNLSF